MCRFKSAIVTRNGDIFEAPETDSHEILINAYGFKDDGSPLAERSWIRVEFTPPKNLDKIQDKEAWVLRVDEDSAPDWWCEIKDRARDDLFIRVQRMMVADERKCLIGGSWILLPGSRVRQIVGGRIVLARSADMRSADMRYVNMSYADMSYADMRSADMRYVNMSYADMSYADMSYADMSYADMRYVNMSYADMSYADMRSADMRYVNMSYADMRGADMRRANMRYADMRGADMRRANMRYADMSCAYRQGTDLAIPGWTLKNGILIRDN